MKPIELTAASFDSTVNGDGIVLVDWWASWCGPCVRFAPIFDAAAAKHSDLVFGKVDTESEQELSAAVGISSIPTLMIFRDGVLLFSQPGALPGEALDDLIDQVKSLDMDTVRAEIAAQASAR